MPEAVIEVEALGKTYRTSVKQPGFRGTLRHYFRRQYREIEAVRSVSFRVERGEVVGFLGANGAGKTTTLKMLTGLVHPSVGRARVAGHEPFRRERGFLERITLVMGNKQQLLWDLPALETLRINAAIYRIDEATARARIDELSALLEIRDKLREPVRKLSLGERMKCELLAALLHQPEVLFLDEPTLGLDVNAQDSIRNFLREYNRRHRATIVLTSHYMADITALCERVLLIHRGALIYDGELRGILERFAPYREVDLTLDAAVADETLEGFGELASRKGRNARLIVRREDLTRTLQRLLRELPVSDLAVKDPPIEQIVGRLFREGSLGGGAPAGSAAR
ncbi:MAG TPA: ATP-binding cassette domain-containing protein [Polyangiaceae bacterium]|nr:ATP-binding cassette domain-containing protein [Polyangiaceae bacterium]